MNFRLLLISFHFLIFSIHSIQVFQALSPSLYNKYNPFSLEISLSKSIKYDPQCQIEMEKMTKNIEMIINIQNQVLDLIQYKTFFYIVFENHELGIYEITTQTIKLIKIQSKGTNIFISIFLNDSLLYLVYENEIIIFALNNNNEPELIAIRSLDFNSNTIITNIDYDKKNCFYYINNFSTINSFCLFKNYNIEIKENILFEKMKEFINNKYNESIVFKFSDILINENNMLLSDIAWGIFWFNITESNNITFVNFDKIVDVKKMELYKTNNYRSKKQTLIIWLETQNDKLQSIQEYDIASKNYIITLLKETQLGLFTAKTETLAGDYIYLAQDNLIKLYRPNIPLETESFELNDLYFDSIKLIKSFDSNKSLPSFIIVQSESILIYNMEMSFMVICKNLENIDEDYSINYEFKTLSCEENMTYYENDNFYYCVFPVKDNIELPYYDNIKEIGLIIGLTIGLVFILIILVFVCLSFKRLRNKYQILAQKEKKNPK